METRQSTTSAVDEFFADYSTGDEAQARKFLDQVRIDVKNGFKTVLLSYGANENQTKAMLAAYENGGFFFDMNGTNQAGVIIWILKLLQTPEYEDLQAHVKIAPFTTIAMSYGLKRPTTQALLNVCTENVEHEMEKGNTKFLIWTNQDTIKTKRREAIGGGQAKEYFSEELGEGLHIWIENMRLNYPSTNLPAAQQKGVFCPLLVPYGQHATMGPEADIAWQAIEILKKALELRETHERVYCACCVNESDAVTLINTLNRGVGIENVSSVSGGMQGKVLNKAASLVMNDKAYQSLLKRFHITPIPTVKKNPILANEAPDDKVINQSLAVISYALKKDDAVIALLAQDSQYKPEAPFAVGGQKAKLTDDQQNKIQQSLMQFRVDYPYQATVVNVEEKQRPIIDRSSPIHTNPVQTKQAVINELGKTLEKKGPQN